MPRDTTRNPTAEGLTEVPQFGSPQEMDRWAPGDHFCQYLLSLVMVGHVEVSVHCCVSADERAARVNESVTTS